MSTVRNKEGLTLVTGATGIIGQAIVKQLPGCVALVRSEEKAKKVLGTEIPVIIGDIRDVDLSNYKFDYIIHAAGETSSKAFIKEPVETIDVAITGTKHLLEFARRLPDLKRFLYLSTMEIYGTPQSDEPVGEHHHADLDSMKVRNCYPLSKIICENLCACYQSEYGVPVNVLRLVQTFGPGVRYSDNRVFGEFARSVIEERDIILKTKGETRRAYLHVNDAVEAVKIVMKSECNGEVFNVANAATYCSIYDMALMVAEEIAGGKIQVRIGESADHNSGYAPTLCMNLDTAKIENLGWKARYGLKQMFLDAISSMEQDRLRWDYGSCRKE